MGYFIPAKFSLIDLPVTLGHEAKPAPLVAIRAKTEGAGKNLREAGEKARKRGDTLTVAQKERCRWHLVAIIASLSLNGTVLTIEITGAQNASNQCLESPDLHHDIIVQTAPEIISLDSSGHASFQVEVTEEKHFYFIEHIP